MQESTFGDVPVLRHDERWRGRSSTCSGTRSPPASARRWARTRIRSSRPLNGQTDWRNDVFFTYGGGLDYEIQPWLSVGVEYVHIARRSNFNEFNFQDDKFTAKVTLQF